jgi:GxxExxY protein
MDKETSASALPRFGGQKSGWTFPHSDVTSRILAAAIHVHRQLGPGFLEKIYERALRMEFTKRRLAHEYQLPVRVHYDGVQIGLHRLDLVVERKVIVELKAAKGIEDIHLATILSYLRATRMEAGLILNFSGPKLAIRRVVCSSNLAAEAQNDGDAENPG